VEAREPRQGVGAVVEAELLRPGCAPKRHRVEHVPEILTQLDADVAALGRLTSARNVALESAAPAPD